ncbi:PAS domain S-box protein, partial [Methanoregula sp.]|uniref:PAS domain S-box protein n=1 Tax=Methanoregula sp. TaxID=2052170 RepID=UPI000CC8C2B1
VGRAAKTRPYRYIVKPWNEREIQTEISIALYKFALDEAFRKEHAELEEWLKERTEDLRHADRELRRSEAWYRLIFERSGEGIFIFEAEGPDRGRFIDVNAAGLAIHGYTRDELLAMKITDLDVPENVEGAPARFEAVLNGEWIRGEMDQVKKDGTVFPIDYRAGLLEHEGRKYVFTFLRDISERKAAERALRESELRSSTLLRAIPDMMFIIARDGTYRDFRVPDESDLAVPADRIIGTNIRSSGFGRETTATILDHIARALETGELQVFEYGLDLPQGVRQYEARLVTLGGDEVLGIVRDITSRRSAEDALRESEEKFRTLFETMLEGFAYCRMIYDDAGRPVDWEYLDTNQRFRELTGLADIKGKRVLEAIPDIRELAPELFELYGRVAATGNPERFAIYFKPLTIWLRCSVPSPKRVYFGAVFDDSTGQK